LLPSMVALYSAYPRGLSGWLHPSPGGSTLIALSTTR
jgi:hypothetical protein